LDLLVPILRSFDLRMSVAFVGIEFRLPPEGPTGGSSLSLPRPRIPYGSGWDFLLVVPREELSLSMVVVVLL